MRLLFTRVVQHVGFATDLDVLGFLALAQQNVDTFVVQVDSLFRQASAIPVHDGDHRQQQGVHRQRTNAVAGFDAISKTRKFSRSVRSRGLDIARRHAKQQRHPVANELRAVVGIEGLDITTRELALEDCIAGVRSNARSDYEAIVPITINAVLQHSADRRPPRVAGHFVEAIEQQATTA